MYGFAQYSKCFGLLVNEANMCELHSGRPCISRVMGTSLVTCDVHHGIHVVAYFVDYVCGGWSCFRDYNHVLVSNDHFRVCLSVMGCMCARSSCSIF